MRKFIIAIILMIVSSHFCDAQIFVKSTEQQFIENAVKEGLFLSKQSFQICNKKTGDLYGFRGKDEFGIQYTVGIKVPNGILLTDKAVHPWKGDLNFKKYKDEYTPILYQSMYSEIKDIPNFVTLDSLNELKEIVDTTIYQQTCSAFDGKGFDIGVTKGEKEGWVVWIVCDKDVDFEKSTTLNFIVYRKDIKIEKKSQQFDINVPNTDKSLLGGLFVVPEYPQIGVIKFNLYGIIAPFKDKWKIYCPFVGITFEEGMEPISQEENSDAIEGKDGDDEPSELTPIEKPAKAKGKKKKNKKD